MVNMKTTRFEKKKQYLEISFNIVISTSRLMRWKLKQNNLIKKIIQIIKFVITYIYIYSIDYNNDSKNNICCTI